MNKQSKKRGTKIQQIVSSMIMLMIFLSLFLCSNNSFIYSGAKANSSSSVVFDTNFMHLPVSAIEYGDTTLVLDTYTNSIIKLKDEKIIQGENSTTSARNANFMFYFNSTIVLVNSKGQTLQEMITLLDAETLNIKYQAQTFDTTVYPYYDRISSYIDNNTLYLFFYSFGVNNGVSDMMLLSISSNEQDFTIHEPHVLELNQDTVGNTFSSNVISINIVKSPTSDKLSCLVHTSTDVFSSEIIGNTISTIASTSIMSDIDSNFKNIKILSIDSNPYVMIEKENSINLYNIKKIQNNYKKFSKWILKNTLKNNLVPISKLLKGEDYFARFLKITLHPSHLFYRCSAGLNSYAVDYQGNILICPAFVNKPETFIGNINTNFYSSRLQELKKSYADNNFTCKNCWAKYACGGECFNMSYIEHKNLSKPVDTMCQLKKFLIMLSVDFWINLHIQKPEIFDILKKMY